ncbi:MAG TPA: hypothetical protein VE035_08980 [Puia sp.]|nr:hypothetical protein [Puia sp.]
MKNLVVVLLSMSGIVCTMKAHGQVKLSVHINIGAQPQWGPVGYDHVDYYYMPDIDVYYSVPRQQFIYLDGGNWRFAAALPERYGSYDVYRGYKVVVNEPEPYRHCELYRERYGRYKGNYDQQVVIRDHHHVEGHEDAYDHPGRNGRGHAYGHDKHHGDHGDHGDNR